MAGSPPPERRPRFTDSRPIYLFVGQDNVEFNIHERLLEKKTKFFNPSPNKPALDTLHVVRLKGQNRFKLPDEDVESMHYLIDFLYGRQIKEIESSPGRDAAIATYLLAIRLEVTLLQDMMVDVLRQYHQKNPLDPFLAVELASKRPSDRPDCKLMTYMMEQIAWDMRSDGWNEYLAAFPEFHRLLDDETASWPWLYQLLKLGMEKGRRTDPAKVTGCHYHAHALGYKCGPIRGKKRPRVVQDDDGWVLG